MRSGEHAVYTAALLVSADRAAARFRYFDHLLDVIRRRFGVPERYIAGTTLGSAILGDDEAVGVIE